ncbi:helix-turn-helix domain-containing protein [Chryseobacterium herbae]|uniref:Helix-turn-helix domain-containing protein n=1 Tax=Chryseobacterium herbae TaxID=2976476 RepID=A0ABT2IZA0_9FLAO|nr:helix-turn-helix domain-containing protein [Chryseobacterium sp. pc1-10]MCT2563650.1 helix-turn-helix domain-containing protein [Chryseobacterium sp. pc1-10]
MEPIISLPIHRALKPIVQSIVVADINFTKLSLNAEYRYPWMNRTSIFFTLDDEPLLLKRNEEYIRVPLCYVVGPRLVNDTVNFGKRRRTVGITFKAGGFQRLMGIPVDILTKENIDLHQIFGKETEEIQEKLKEAKGNNEILRIIENFLLKRIYSIRDFSLFDLSIEQCVKSRGNMSIEKLASTAALSTRQFERRCKESLGISPKLFSRLTRFSNAYTLKERCSGLSWITIAHESGYYDQMHLIRDFKLFSGYSPGGINEIELHNLKIISILESE